MLLTLLQKTTRFVRTALNQSFMEQSLSETAKQE